MSYCRWSSDNSYCDVYVYESYDGFITHVAGSRQPEGAPDHNPDIIGKDGVDAWLKAKRKHTEWRKTVELLPIDNPHAGDSFSHATAKECAENLLELRASGLNVPQHAIDRLLSESDG